MTEPVSEPVAVPARSPWALWGSAHLAWGIAIFLALLFAAQQTPVESTVRLERFAWAFYALGLLWIALSGWRSVERGWRLRSPTTPADRHTLSELLADLLLGVAALLVFVRGSQSRLLAAGLDRVVSALITVALISAALAVIDLAVLRYPGRQPERPERRFGGARLALAAGLIALAAMVEFSAW